MLVTTDSMNSHRDDQPEPWIWACDPDWTREGPDEGGYEGRVQVAWVRVYQPLYEFLFEGRFYVKDIWREARQPNMSTHFWFLTKLDRSEWPRN